MFQSASLATSSTGFSVRLSPWELLHLRDQFERNSLTSMEDIRDLSKEDLKEVGVSQLKQRKTFFREVENWTNQTRNEC